MAFMVRLLRIPSLIPRRAEDVSRPVHGLHVAPANCQRVTPVNCLRVGFIAVVALALAGCQKPDEITRYTVAKPPPRETKATVPSTTPKPDVGSPQSEDGQDQLLGAIIPHGKMTWFFKLTGPSEAVESQMKQFAKFLGSIKFSDAGKSSDKGPDWSLPPGWDEEPGSDMRFATIRIAVVEGPLEMSVIPLETGEGSFDTYLLSNVNRWREQFGLPPIAEEQLAEKVHKMELGETSMWIVKLEGHMQKSGMGRAPFAGQAAASREPRAGTPSRGPAQNRAATPFDCEIPEGWTVAQAGQFQLAVYEVRDGDRQVTISVSAAGGELAANVNRWREQVQLVPLTAAELDKEVRKIKVDGHEGSYVEAVGPEPAAELAPGSLAPGSKKKPRETILGVIVEAQGRQWFLKLNGDAELAAHEKPHFEKFVKSIRFRGN